MASLLSIDGSSQIDLEDGDVLKIGRSSECEIEIEDSSVSTLHAIISLKDNVLVIQDQGSTNGIRVNYADTNRHILVHGDVLEVGNVSFNVSGKELKVNEVEPNVEEAPVESVDLFPGREAEAEAGAVSAWKGALATAILFLVGVGLMAQRIQAFLGGE